ncbi:MAG: Type 1 glutamine amidotransferase-like domain-containing protein [Deltaproteobacteria bacterium]|jgi:peptidase E|nr:Type 1 glutamine amidotransferase-like domain-containing protein [Deltaproteobacteria bacterium]
MKKTPDNGSAFYRAIIGDRKTANVLICCFAMPFDKWQTGFEDDKRQITLFNDRVSLFFDNADLNNFIKQVAWANVIVFRGGSTKDLINRLAKVNGWQVNLSGKTIVGSSAGAYMLSSNYVVTDVTPQLAQGLGLLPIVIATHYRSTFIHNGDVDKSQIFWDDVDDLMKSNADGRNVVTLKEGSFIILSETNS